MSNILSEIPFTLVKSHSLSTRFHSSPTILDALEILILSVEILGLPYIMPNPSDLSNLVWISYESAFYLSRFTDAQLKVLILAGYYSEC